MQPDTEGGRIQREARRILLSREEGFVHVMAVDFTIDPPYTRSWAGIAEALHGMTLVLPAMSDFFKWSDFLLPKKNGGSSSFYIVPGGENCFRGPNSNGNKFRISESHYLNFGYGEDATGKVVAHHGVWFSRNTFAQGPPDEVTMWQQYHSSTVAWQQKRQDETAKRPIQKQTELNTLAYLKLQDLHDLGKIMSRSVGDFAKRYPNPDEGKDGRSEKHKLEQLQEIRRILCKNEDRWTSVEFYEMLRWHMRKLGGGHTVFKTLAQRKAKWKKILLDLSSEGHEELETLRTPLEPNNQPAHPSLSLGGDSRYIDENEHVDDDEFFGVDDIPWKDVQLVQGRKGKRIYTSRP